jgi:hypothetical protein
MNAPDIFALYSAELIAADDSVRLKFLLADLRISVPITLPLAGIRQLLSEHAPGAVLQ